MPAPVFCTEPHNEKRDLVMFVPAAAPRRTRPIRRHADRRPVVAEPLEDRRLFAVTTLTIGSGDGSLSVTVDAYGAYGRSSDAGDAIYDPVNIFDGGVPVGPKGTTFESAVYLSTRDGFLAEGSLGTAGTDVLPGVAFTSGSSTTATSTFTVGNLKFTLLQKLLPPADGQTVLEQTYTIENIGGAPLAFDLVRHVDGDMEFKPGLADFAGATANNQFVFEFDTAGGAGESSGFFGLTRGGTGTYLGYAIRAYDYKDEIVEANGIPLADRNRVGGDINGDRLTDSAYDVTISQQDQFNIPGGGTATYITRTIFGQGSPVDLINPGEFEVQPDATVDEDAGTVTVTINRVRGSGGPVTVDYATLAGSAVDGTDFTGVAGTLNFANGQTSATFTVPIINDNVVETLEAFQVVISNPTNGATLGARQAGTVTIVDEDAGVQFAVASFAGKESDGNVVVTVIRAGSSRDPMTVDYATADGTAVAGADYTAVAGTLAFAAGQSSATFTVPVTPNDGDDREPVETINLSIANVVGTSSSLGTPSAATIFLSNVDSRAPRVAAVTTTANSRGRINGIRVAFDEDMHRRRVVQKSAFTLWDRGVDGRRGRGQDVTLPIRRMRYNAEDNSVTLTPRRALDANRVYQLSANGYVADPSGNRLDGTGTGRPGSAYNAFFARGKRVSYVDSDGDLVTLRVRGSGQLELFRAFTGDASVINLLDAGDDTSLTGTISSRGSSDGATEIGTYVGPASAYALGSEFTLGDDVS